LGVGCATTPAQMRRFLAGRLRDGGRSAQDVAVNSAAREGSATDVTGAPIAAAATGQPEFRLTDAGPNPGSGPLRIGFALAHAAEIEIGVFDLLGRQVASLARGNWPAGAHEVQWNGRGPAGLYMLRYRYPGGADRRTIVRVQ